MTIEERNAMIAAIAAVVGCPVVLSDQVQPEAEPPYIIYTMTNPYGPGSGLGEYSQTVKNDTTVTEMRAEQPTATVSFTACSINRWDGDRYIYGEDEAQTLATAAQGWLLFGGHLTLSQLGIVVVEIMNAGGRSTLEVDEAARRFGFDARLRYTRRDIRDTGVVDKVRIPQKKE